MYKNSGVFLKMSTPLRRKSGVDVSVNLNKPLPPITVTAGERDMLQSTSRQGHMGSSVCDVDNGSGQGELLFQPKTMKRRNLKKLTLGDESPSSNPVSSLSSPVNMSLRTPVTILSTKSTEDLELAESFKKLSTTLNRDFEIRQQDLLTLKSLGEGQSGVVSKVLHVPSNKIMAKKQILFEKNIKVQNQIVRELKILQEVDSPYIVEFYGATFIDTTSSTSEESTITPTEPSSNDQQAAKQAVVSNSSDETPSLSANGVIICLEYMDCGSLDHILKQLGYLKEVYLSKITHNVLQGLDYLYSTHKIIHRDIKPSNVLLSSKGEVKICDFGVSRELSNNSIADTFVGTSTYMSPERIQGDVYNIRGDVWSLGLMLIELSTGEFPFGKKDTPNGILDLLQRIVNEDPPSLPRNRYSKELCDFVELCLKKQNERPTPLELLNLPNGLLKKYEREKSGPLLRHLAKKLR